MTTPNFLQEGQHHPTVMSLFEHFEYDHLSEDLQAVSKPFYLLAEAMLMRMPSEGARFDVMIALGLENLLTAKDCFVRAAVKEKRERQHTDAVDMSEHLQTLRKQAIVDFAAKIERVTPENPMGVELPSDDPFPGGVGLPSDEPFPGLD